MSKSKKKWKSTSVAASGKQPSQGVTSEKVVDNPNRAKSLLAHENYQRIAREAFHMERWDDMSETERIEAKKKMKESISGRSGKKDTSLGVADGMVLGSADVILDGFLLG